MSVASARRQQQAWLAAGHNRRYAGIEQAPEVTVSPDTIARAALKHDAWKVARDYQLEGIQFLRDRKRAMLTDAPGLGKTLQSSVAAELPVLVAAPGYLVDQWGAFLTEQFGPLGHTVAVAEGWRRKRYLAVKANADWTVVNHEMLRDANDWETGGYMFPEYRTLIIDEAHHLRNRKAKQSKGALEIANKAEYVFLLTATPIWKEADDLFMQLRIMHPDLFTSYYNFVDYFCVADAGRFGTKVLGVRRTRMRELDMLLSYCRMGRTAAEVGRQLPELTEQYVKINFPKELRDKYRAMKTSYRFEELQFDNYSQVMLALRQCTAFPGKIDAIADLVDDLNGQPVVVFVWYKWTAELIAAELRRRGIHPSIITGEVGGADRAQLAKSSNVVIATIASLSEGVDLSHVRYVVFAEEHYTPGSNYQALSRMRRERADGSTDPVVAYYVHVRGTVDEAIHRVSRSRTATIKEVLKEALA